MSSVVSSTSGSNVAASGYMAFLECLTDYLDEQADRDEFAALLVVHLCNLGRINTSAGYRTGYALRRAFMGSVKGILRAGDWMMPLTENRLAVVLDGVRNRGHLMLAADRIARLADAVPRTGGPGPVLEVRVGAALFPEHGRSAEKLLRCSELAVELAALQKTANAIYRPEESRLVIDTWGLEARLRTALENEELSVAYQPKVHADSRTPCGAEALLRWHNPALGAVPPARFIPVAEASETIDALTSFALRSAARDAAAWPTVAGELSIAVNLSPTVIERGDIVASFEHVAAIWGLGLERFTAEVTENGIVSTAGRALEVLGDLRRAGIRVSIDDFGTGNSSLAYFRDIPADEVKIDKSFVAALSESEANVRLVQAIVDLAHGFGLTVVAEGVESAACADRLQALGCDVLQGYWFAKPLAQEELLRWLGTNGAGAHGSGGE